MFVCSECGAASPDDLGFCRKCGSVNGRHVDDSVAQDKIAVETQYGSVFVDEKDAKRVPIAMLLAFIPGFFDVFGLGQLYMRKYLDGAVFLGITALIMGVRYFGILPFLGSYIWIIGLGVFILQLLDMNRIVAKLFR